MATPQDQQRQSDVERLAAAAMGVAPPPAAAATPEAAAAQQSGAPPQAQKPPEKDTEQDKAAEAGSPKTEADKQGEDPVLYEIDMGDGKKRAFTPGQLKGTLERYSALNYRQAQAKPVLDLVDKIIKENPGLNHRQLADKLDEIYKAGDKNVTLGKNAPAGSDPAPGDPGKDGKQEAQDPMEALARWESDNAVSLPPGYKEMMQGGPAMAQMQQQMMQMQQMLQAVLAQAGGTADAARQGMQQAQGQQVQAMRQQIGNNLDRVQAALKIPDDKANDFMVYAAERGYTLEDFIDPQLTIKVMQDFRNNMDSPEMERMRQIAQRRQAFTGSMGATPGTGALAEAGASGDTSTFDQMAATVMRQRGLG